MILFNNHYCLARNFFGSGQNFAHPLLHDRYISRSEITRVLAYSTHVYTVYRVTRLYGNGIYASDERHAMIFFSD